MMLTNIFRTIFLLIIVTVVSGCSGYSSAVNTLGPKTPTSEMREQIEAPVELAEGESPFCALPVEPEPEMEPAIAALPREPYRARLYFIFDTSTFTPESEIAAQKVFDEVRARQIAEAIVIGHTDTMGSEEYNIGLSERRAERVRQELIRRGIPENIITTKCMGESELLIETADEVAEVRNRRVEIDVR
ncbi:OmpA family protein [Methylophaga sp. SB9B]|uniref:OmpA family protein n=1 Tax=Methylophaga sp. SB9B TaxID=2570356 RepID=UPI0010A836DB|nr:OmpA family protein [Methylophaga sp. SB9B]THK40804.1 OmpA family protein [Methylophaga sp. SB9B]